MHVLQRGRRMDIVLSAYWCDPITKPSQVSIDNPTPNLGQEINPTPNGWIS